MIFFKPKSKKTRNHHRLKNRAVTSKQPLGKKSNRMSLVRCVVNLAPVFFTIKTENFRCLQVIKRQISRQSKKIVSVNLMTYQ